MFTLEAAQKWAVFLCLERSNYKPNGVKKLENSIKFKQ